MHVIQQKLAKFAQILGILNNTFKPNLVKKSSTIKVYNALSLHILLYGSEIWTLRQKDIKRLASIEMTFFRDSGIHKRIEEILEELKVKPVDEKVRRRKSNQLQHVTRMNNKRMSKNNADLQTKQTKTTWKTFEQTITHEAETCLLRPNS